jgi:hypothetical protein
VELADLLAAVRNDRIEFATMRPRGATTAALERRVVLTGPAEVRDLATVGDVRVLDALVDLLRDPARAWAAEVVLAALTHEDGKVVDTFSGRPQAWWEVAGRGAHERWSAWLRRSRGRLTWNPDDGAFVEADRPSGPS